MRLILFLATAAGAIPTQSFELRGTKGDTINLEEAPVTPIPLSSGVFEPAMDLEYFANLDPNVFEWMSPDEIKPGETTCGFLTAPLGWDVDDVDVVYPEVKVCESILSFGQIRYNKSCLF